MISRTPSPNIYQRKYRDETENENKNITREQLKQLEQIINQPIDAPADNYEINKIKKKHKNITQEELEKFLQTKVRRPKRLHWFIRKSLRVLTFLSSINLLLCVFIPLTAPVHLFSTLALLGITAVLITAAVIHESLQKDKSKRTFKQLFKEILDAVNPKPELEKFTSFIKTSAGSF